MIASMLSVARPAEAHSPIQRGKYDCYIYYVGLGPVYQNRRVKIVDASTYRYYNGTAWKTGRFAHGQRRISWKTGYLFNRREALQIERTVHVITNGRHEIDFYFEGAPNFPMTCWHV